MQDSDGAWRSFWPDRIDLGPARLWLTIGGSLLHSAPRSGRRQRAGCTLWAGSVAPEGWRRLHIVACWHMQRARRAGGSP